MISNSVTIVCFFNLIFFDKNHGLSLSGSLGYKTTSLTLSIPIKTVISLSNPIPQPECGGIPHPNVFKCSSKLEGSRSCSFNLDFVLLALILIVLGREAFFHLMIILNIHTVNQMSVTVLGHHLFHECKMVLVSLASLLKRKIRDVFLQGYVSVSLTNLHQILF